MVGQVASAGQVRIDVGRVIRDADGDCVRACYMLAQHVDELRMCVEGLTDLVAELATQNTTSDQQSELRRLSAMRRGEQA